MRRAGNTEIALMCVDWKHPGVDRRKRNCAATRLVKSVSRGLGGRHHRWSCFASANTLFRLCPAVDVLLLCGTTSELRRAEEDEACFVNDEDNRSGSSVGLHE